MNPFNLVREGSTTVVALACGNCRRVYALNDPYAIRCCDPRCDCGAPPRPGWSCCEACLEKRNAEREADLIAKAKRVAEEDYSGPVYHDGAWNEGYLRDTDEFREWWESNHDGEPLPAHVWGCTTRILTIPSADVIVDDATQDAYEGASDDMPDTAALQAAIDAYNASVTAEAWEVENKTLVMLRASQAGDAE